jgi:hypothetical protein
MYRKSRVTVIGFVLLVITGLVGSACVSSSKRLQMWDDMMKAEWQEAERAERQKAERDIARAHWEQTSPNSDYDWEGDFDVIPSNGTDRFMIIRSYLGSASVLRIPSQIEGLPVKGISTQAFYGKSFTHVTIPNSVTALPKYAFGSNSQLNHIVIGDGVASLDEAVFEGSLRNVKSISIGHNVNLSGYSDVVWRGFSAAYQANGNRAGVYTLTDGRWSFQPR